LSAILAACRHALDEASPSFDLLKQDQSAVARGDLSVMPNDDLSPVHLRVVKQIIQEKKGAPLLIVRNTG
jgi:hypothetical protein